ncbi:MAG: PfaD family polyunsaturated fatty acid/polyketide biosynthesis protein [Chloroflexota bacterium]
MSSQNKSLVYDPAAVAQGIRRLDQPCYLVRTEHGIGWTDKPDIAAQQPAARVIYAPPQPVASLGDATFSKFYGARAGYMAGAMANGISSAQMVIALGKAGYLGSFGAAGLAPAQVEAAISEIQAALTPGTFAFNLIHSPSEPALEKRIVDLYLAHGVTTVEASAFLSLTPQIVRYRLAGLDLRPDASLHIKNRVIAKVSQPTVARQFLQPPPPQIISALYAEGAITARQAELARFVPMADDITVEANSGGHTDNRPLVNLFPTIARLRDEVAAQSPALAKVRLGAAGGIGTPEAVLAAFTMGAAYVVTGSVNQACVESGTSDEVRAMLAQAEMTDTIMAPAADMFEMGVDLQVLKKGTLFPMRARRLYTLYKTHESIDQIPEKEREQLERQIFGERIDVIWRQTQAYFQVRDADQIRRAERDPHHKMALIFRWYLGQSSSWATKGVASRQADYQIWCGPAMGAFNRWVAGTPLEQPENRKVAYVANALMEGAAYLQRLQFLRVQGLADVVVG